MKQQPKWTEFGSRFTVAGTRYFDYKKIRASLRLGQQVRFVGNPSNIYDNKAIRVLVEGVQIGWVPKGIILQHGMWCAHDAGSKLIGVITSVRINMAGYEDNFEVQTLVLHKCPVKLTKKQADIEFCKMKAELSYMVK